MIGIVASILFGVYLIKDGQVFDAVIYVILGCLSSWVGCFCLYGFGHLIENTDIIVKRLKNDNEEDAGID
jgi:membrane protein DedA with SNARE-associated domain